MWLISFGVTLALVGCGSTKTFNSPPEVCVVHHQAMQVEKIQVVPDLPNGETPEEHEYEKKHFPHHGGVVYFPKLSFQANASVCTECTTGYLHWREEREKQSNPTPQPVTPSGEVGKP